MLFNSYMFIFGFLPLVLLGFYGIGRSSRRAAIGWLIAASLVFYGWWRPLNVLLMAPSIMLNYALARLLLRHSEARPRLAQAVLGFGIAFNLCFLGYFKYVNFIETSLNDLVGTSFVMTELILPLGISFITFQKIAFLVDVHAGRVRAFRFQDYALFVLFFPQLIAGPIVHYREMMPQFEAASCRFDAREFAVAASLFFMGLFKKLILADQIAPYATKIFTAAGMGAEVTFVSGWMAALGFTLQIYFDFSGYTDMALGLARFFGIKLPMNFNSPLKATSIIDFWLRWHISLTRFLTAYLYNPVVLHLTRARLAAGKPGVGGKNTTIGSFVVLLAAPTTMTMFVSGLWHGAGYQFLIWGLLHGVFLSVNHAWRILRPRFWTGPGYALVMRPVGFVLTFLSVVAAMVMFRASSVGEAASVWAGMLGLHGVALPNAIMARLGGLGASLAGWGVQADFGSGADFVWMSVWVSALLAIAWLAPNTLEIMAQFEPALGFRSARPAFLEWRPSAGWAMGLAVVAALGILSLGQLSTFLYWQF